MTDRFYSYDPEDGFDEHDSEDAAEPSREGRSGPGLRDREWYRLSREVRERGYKPGWAWHRYRVLFGEQRRAG